jgi:putative transposase
MIQPSLRKTVHAVKSVSFRYTASQELTSLFEDFRMMCNEAIIIANREKPENRFSLIKLAYHRLKNHGLHTHYIMSACEAAYSAYKNKKRKRVPSFTKPFLKLDNQSYQLSHMLLRIPTSPRRFTYLTLEGSDYQFSFVDNPSLKRGSVTLTERSASIAFSKEVELAVPVGYIGMDTNEKNVTISATDGFEHKFTELGEVVEIKERYKEIRAKIGKTVGQDKRISKGLFAKYGRREKNRTSQCIHRLTRKLVDYASEKNLGIKMERLKGIRKLYRKGNGQGASFRGRMNSWVFGETQRQIDYKAAWLGVPVTYVNPKGTSSYCLCGSRVVPLADRKLYCPMCDKTWDRDDLASKKVMACAVPQVRPLRGSDDGERGDDGSNPLSRWGEGRLGS